MKADCNKDQLYTEYHIDSEAQALIKYKYNMLIIDSRLPGLGARRAFGMYVASYS